MVNKNTTYISQIAYKLPRFFLVYLEISVLQSASHHFFSPRYLAGTCVPTSNCRNKKSNFISCHVKPTISSFTPTLITLNDRQTQDKEFPVVAILLQGSLKRLFWKGA
jgi:hypothetical protein